MIAPNSRLRTSVLAEDRSSAFAIFARLWTLAGIFHQLHRSDLVSSPLTLGIALSACLVWLAPSKSCLLGLFCVLRAVLYLHHAPNAGNHEFFAFYADCSIVLGLLVFRFRGGDASERIERELRFVFALLRVATLVLYFFAVLHKLNSCYLSPGSCGGTLLWNYLGRNSLTSWVTESFPTGENWFRYANIYASLVIEAAIPLLLVCRRTAWIGCLLGMAFHFLLGIAYFWHFTPLLYALFITFLPIDFFRGLSRVLDRLTGSRLFKNAIYGAIVSLFALYLAKDYSGLIRWEFGQFSRQASNSWRFGANIRTVLGCGSFIVFSCGLGFGVFKYARSGSSKVAEGCPLWPVASLSLLLLANGFSPYLGLKTHSSFAMFSGLSVAEGKSNHLFLPSVPLTYHSLDTVRPTGPDFSNYQSELRWKSDEALLFFELRKRVAELAAQGVTGIRISYVRNGERFDLANAENDAELTEPVSWFDRKFRVFQPIPVDSCDCRY